MSRRIIAAFHNVGTEVVPNDGRSRNASRIEYRHEVTNRLVRRNRLRLPQEQNFLRNHACRGR